MTRCVDPSCQRRRCLRTPVALAALVVAVVTVTRGGFAAFCSSFTASGANHATQSLVTRHSVVPYGPLVRRDSGVETSMQGFLKMQTKIDERMASGGFTQKGKSRLIALGLADKVAAMEAPWHEKHIVPGDQFQGFFMHPNFEGGNKVEVAIVMNTPFTGSWEAVRGGEFEGPIEILQDHAITVAKGEERNQDMAAWVFSKYSRKWRNFGAPLPTPEELEYIDLPSLQYFFLAMASVDGYPPEEEYVAAIADPAKGMTRNEFINWLESQETGYLDKAFGEMYGTRRFQMRAGGMVFDGDFLKPQGRIAGYVEFNRKPGGQFQFTLAQIKSTNM